MNGDTLVIDIETKKSFDEVGGKHNIRELGISVAGVWSYGKNAFFAFEEHELPELENMLAGTNGIIGFNINSFDIPVMEPYFPDTDFSRIAVTDMFEDAVAFLGHRVGLGALAKATLGVGKSGHGLEALRWFKEGRVEDVKKYCLDDVKITRDLYEFGKARGHVLFESFVDGKVHSIPVRWGGASEKPVALLLEEAFHKRERLEIEYVSSEDPDALGFTKTRLVDIYSIKKGEFEAYCHLRGEVRRFRTERTLKARPTGEKYALPQDLQHSLF